MASTSRSGRILKPSKQAMPHANKDTLVAGFRAFNAKIGNHSDGKQSTEVSLIAGVKRAEGSSKSTCHAEMDALNKILKSCGDNLETVIGKKPKSVSCTAKPVCYRCAVVLGLLGFSPATADTKKNKSGMGQTQWVLPEPLCTAIEDRFGLGFVDLLNGFPNIDKL